MSISTLFGNSVFKKQHRKKKSLSKLRSCGFCGYHHHHHYNNHYQSKLFPPYTRVYSKLNNFENHNDYVHTTIKQRTYGYYVYVVDL